MRTKLWLLGVACVLAGCQAPPPDTPLIRSDEEFVRISREAEKLSGPGLRAYEFGEEMTAPLKADLQRARKMYLNLRDFGPGLYTVHFALGKICRALEDDREALGHFAQAVANLERVPELRPEGKRALAEALAEISRIQVLANNIEAAELAGERAVELFPKDPAYLVTLASARVQAKKLDEARKLLAEVERLDPGNRMAHGLRTLIGP